MKYTYILIYTYCIIYYLIAVNMRVNEKLAQSRSYNVSGIYVP